MKKFNLFIILFLSIFFISSCAGYKPIFSTSNFQFNIEDFYIAGDKALGKKLYSRLYNLSRSNKNENSRSILVSIDVKKNKEATVKDKTGKIIEYKITLDTKITVDDYLTDKIILNHNFNVSSSYTVQDQYSETVKLENKSIENLIDKIFQNLIIKLSGNISK